MAVRYVTDQRACSCPDWMYRPARRPCKHVREIKAAVDLLDRQDAHNRYIKEQRQANDNRILI